MGRRKPVLTHLQGRHQYQTRAQKVELLDTLLEMQRKLKEVDTTKLRPGWRPKHAVRNSWYIDAVKLRQVRAECHPNNKKFGKMTGFSYEVFSKYVSLPWCALIIEAEAGIRGRRNNLSPRLRVFRALLWTKGRTLTSLAEKFGQDATTVARDIRKLIILANEHLVDKWITQPKVGSPEYMSLLGVGDFKSLYNVIGSMDCNRIEVLRSHADDIQVDFYNKKPKCHTTSEHF